MAKGKKRPVQSARRRPKVAVSARPARESGNKALVIRRPAAETWNLSDEEVTLLKNAICRAATDEELKFCLATARRYKLDPFKKQIWFVPRWDSEALKSDGGKGRTVFTPQVSVDGLQHIAARDHKDYGSVSEPTWGPHIEVSYQVRGQGPTLKLKVPEWARVDVWKKDAAHPTTGLVFWNEIYTDVDYAPLVRKMPRLMLAKCARAQAIRAAYPATGGLLVVEECQSREFTDITPEGRIMQRAESPEEAYRRREAEQLAMLPPAEQEKIKARQAAKDGLTPVGAVDLKLPASAAPAIDIQVKPPIEQVRMTDPSKFGAITWIWDYGKNIADLGGDKAAREAAWPLIRKFWVNAPEKRYVISGDDLEDLKARLPMAGFKFERADREPGE